MQVKNNKNQNLLNRIQIEEMDTRNKNHEILNIIERKCEGLEALLCNNVINKISRKIDMIERNCDDTIIASHKASSNDRKSKIKTKNEISLINENINAIENSFKNNPSTKDSPYSDTIRKKIEENYMLLNELEKSNRPIFTSSIDAGNRMIIEDKIKEMENKLDILFKSDNSKSHTIRSTGLYTYKATDYRYDSVKGSSYGKADTDNLTKEDTYPEDGNTVTKTDKDARKKELYERLGNTEKRIKEIARSLLNDF